MSSEISITFRAEESQIEAGRRRSKAENTALEAEALKWLERFAKEGSKSLSESEHESDSQTDEGS